MHLLCQAFVLFSEPEEYVSFPSSCCFKSLLEEVNPKNITCELILISLSVQQRIFQLFGVLLSL